MQIGYDIIYMLRTDRQPDRIRLNPLIRKFFLRKLTVSRGRRVDDQALHIGNIGKQREDLQTVNKLMGFLHAAPDLKCKDLAASIREISLIQLMIRMILKGGMIHLLDLRMRRKKFHNLRRISRMPFQPQG